MDNEDLTYVRRKRAIRFPIPLTVKIDMEMYDMLGLIADFEHKAPATLARDVLIDKIQTFERYPAFKRYGPYREYLRKKGKDVTEEKENET